MADIRNIWKRTPTPEIEALARQLQDEAWDHGFELDLSEILFLAFKAGFEASNQAQRERGLS